MTDRMKSLETLRALLEQAWTAALDAGFKGDITMDLSLQDALADCAGYIREEQERVDAEDPEVQADIEADRRHYRAPLGCGTYGKV